MDNIILTQNKNDGERLKVFLQAVDNSFREIKCFTKEDIVSKSNEYKKVTTIWSTWYMPVFSEGEIHNYFPSLEYVFYAAGTVKYFAVPFLNSGVRVFSASKANGVSVAEFVVAQIVLANKGYFQTQQAYRWPMTSHGFFKTRRISELKVGNYEAKIGIVGCGMVGSKVVELLKPYKFDVCIYDPFISDERIKELGTKKLELDELFSTSDVVSNHLPDIASTMNLIDYSLLSKMKPTSTFINTGRGRQVVESDLCKVLRNNPMMCALLDVTVHEPLYPWSPLYWCKNVFITPHIAGCLSMELKRMVECMVHVYQDILSGCNNQCEVLLEQLVSNR